MLDSISNILNNLEDERLFVVDVGCHKGHFRDQLFSVVRKPIYIVGIDPMNHDVSDKYDKYIKIAIDDVDSPTIKSFYEYIEPGCNSLLPMNIEIITHNDPNDTNKWFVNQEIEKLINKSDVAVDSLQNAIDFLGMNILKIHLIKVIHREMI